MKKTMAIILALAAALVMATSCDLDGRHGVDSLKVPELMRGTWSSSSSTLVATEDNIVITNDRGTGVNMLSLVAMGNGLYTVGRSADYIDITFDGGLHGYYFQLTNGRLRYTVRAVGGGVATVWYDKVVDEL